MKIRKYEAPTIMEAYSLVKKDLGSAAVILKTRTYKKGGILGLWGTKMVELTASDSIAVPSREVKKSNSSAPPGASSLLAKAYQQKTNSPPPVRRTEDNAVEKEEYAPTQPGISTERLEEEGDDSEDWKAFRRELGEIRKMIQDMRQPPGEEKNNHLPAGLEKLKTRLKEYDIDDDVSRGILLRLKSHHPGDRPEAEADEKLLERCVEEMIVPGGPVVVKKGVRPTVVMLVGPTGVGKTTTLAKLAARHRLSDGHSVGLITVDTYRIAAVEQLKTYADLIGIPLRVASSKEEVSESVNHFRESDLVFIDTAGRSPRSREHMKELLEIVEEAKPDELYLVISANASASVMKDTLQRFEDFPVNKLLLTKLDETDRFGSVLSLMNRTQKPLGYLTTGQRVPEDIEVADSKRLTRLILAREVIHA